MAGDEPTGPTFGFMRLVKSLVALFSRKSNRRRNHQHRTAMKKRTANTSEILAARRSAFIPLPPDPKDN